MHRDTIISVIRKRHGQLPPRILLCLAANSDQLDVKSSVKENLTNSRNKCRWCATFHRRIRRMRTSRGVKVTLLKRLSCRSAWVREELEIFSYIDDLMKKESITSSREPRVTGPRCQNNWTKPNETTNANSTLFTFHHTLFYIALSELFPWGFA